MSSIRGCFVFLRKWQIPTAILLTAVFMIAQLPIPCLHAEDKTKVLMGGVEEIILFPWGVRLPARIDTGAGMTSLDVRDLTVKNKVAQFRLPEKYGNTLISLPVVRHCNVQSAGSKSRRPVVEIEVCVGSKRMRVEVNLSSRSHLEFPLIVGRNVLSQGFIVDSSQEKVLPPRCLEGDPQ
jgi:hypothetical protein